MGRPLDQHIDEGELNALVPWASGNEQPQTDPSADLLIEAERHVASCADCRRKVSRYKELVIGLSNIVVWEPPPQKDEDCPEIGDLGWREVATGKWPELKATQLIMHAALCNHCGLLLRSAVSASASDVPVENQMAGVPSRPMPSAVSARKFSPGWGIKWAAPIVAMLAIVGGLFIKESSSRQPLSGPEFAAVAVHTHRQHASGGLALEVLSDSPESLNEWFKAKSRFLFALPTSLPVAGEKLPYRLEGARLVLVSGKTAAYIAYQVPTTPARTVPASLMVTPDSVAVASGGIGVDFKKVSFHYAMVDNYRVVTWSQHGLTYALVSQEGNDTQRSCMVCHSAMRDRDLSQTPTPLQTQRKAGES